MGNQSFPVDRFMAKRVVRSRTESINTESILYQLIDEFDEVVVGSDSYKLSFNGDLYVFKAQAISLMEHPPVLSKWLIEADPETVCYLDIADCREIFEVYDEIHEDDHPLHHVLLLGGSCVAGLRNFMENLQYQDQIKKIVVVIRLGRDGGALVANVERD